MDSINDYAADPAERLVVTEVSPDGAARATVGATGERRASAPPIPAPSRPRAVRRSRQQEEEDWMEDQSFMVRGDGRRCS